MLPFVPAEARAKKVIVDKKHVVEMFTDSSSVPPTQPLTLPDYANLHGSGALASDDRASAGITTKRRPGTLRSGRAKSATPAARSAADRSVSALGAETAEPGTPQRPKRLAEEALSPQHLSQVSQPARQILQRMTVAALAKEFEHKLQGAITEEQVRGAIGELRQADTNLDGNIKVPAEAAYKMDQRLDEIGKHVGGTVDQRLDAAQQNLQYLDGCTTALHTELKNTEERVMKSVSQDLFALQAKVQSISLAQQSVQQATEGAFTTTEGAFHVTEQAFLELQQNITKVQAEVQRASSLPAASSSAAPPGIQMPVESVRALIQNAINELQTQLGTAQADNAVAADVRMIALEAEAAEMRRNVVELQQYLRQAACRGQDPLAGAADPWGTAAAAQVSAGNAAPATQFQTPARRAGGGNGPGAPGGPPGGGGGRGSGGGGDWFDLSPHGGRGIQSGRQISPYTKLFDTKAAKDELPRHDGGPNGSLWRKKVTYYLVSKCADMRNLLRWAELEKVPITSERLRTAVGSHPLLSMLDDGCADPAVLSYHLWGFLNVNLVDKAWNILDGVEMENGFEVWRRVLQDLTQKSPAEILRLEDAVLTPPICQRMENIPQALVEWEASHRTWIEAGGAGLDDHRTVGAILRLLPEEVRNRALWDYEAYQDAPEKLKAWLRDKVKLLGTWKGGAKPVHVLVGGEDSFEDAECRSCEEEFCDLASLDHTATNAQICAVFRRQFANGGAQVRDRAQTRQPPRREAPPRDLRDVQCPNCHRKGHLARDCTEPQKARDARTCFKCGKTGHLKKDCPEGQAAHALEAAPPAAPAARRIVIASLEDEDGFVPVQRQRAARARTGAEQRPSRATTSTATRPTPAAAATASTRRPAPARHTLADHFGGVFARLAKLEQKEAEAEAAGAPRRPPDPVPLNCLFSASLEPISLKNEDGDVNFEQNRAYNIF